MRKSPYGLLIALSVALLGTGYSNARAAGSSPNFPFGDGIHLEEVADDNTHYPLVSSADVHEVDVNSIIWVQIDPPAIANSLPRPRIAASQPPLPQPIAEQRAALLSALDALNKDLRAIQELTRNFSETLLKRESPEFNDLIRQQGEAENALITAVTKYLQMKYVREGSKGKTPDDMADELFADALAQWAPRLRNYLEHEIISLDQESSQRLSLVESESNEFSLEMKASLQKQSGAPTERIHLPGYDTAEEGAFKSLDKISFTPSDEQATALKTEMAFNRDLAARLNETSNLRSAITQGVQQVSGNIKSQITSFIQEAESASSDIQKIALVAAAESRARALKLRTRSKQDAASAVEIAQRGLGDYSSLFRSIQTELSSSLPTSSGLNALSEQADPLAVLTSLVPASEKFPAAMEDATRRLNTISTVIASSVTINLGAEAVASEADVKDELQAEKKLILDSSRAIQDRIERFRHAQVEPLLATLGNLKSRLGNLRAAQPTQVISDGLNSNLVDSKSIVRSYAELVDTKISIPNTSRQEGDNVNLDLVARGGDDSSRKDSPVIGERKITLKIRKFGPYSEFSSGVAAFFGTQADKKRDAEFGAMATWILHDRVRDSNVWNTLNLGIGVHTAGITNGLGMGASLHLFPGNFLQVGGGRTMRSTSPNQWYWFVGIRLINLKLPSSAGSP